MLSLIVYVLASQRNCWLFTARKPKVLHLSRQTLKHNKVSSMNELRSIRQLLTHHELPMKTRTKMSKTMKIRSQHKLARTEKRKEIQTDETAKELRALLSVTDSSLASPLRPCGEPQEQLERSSKQARTARKGVETPQDVSHLSRRGIANTREMNFFK